MMIFIMYLINIMFLNFNNPLIMGILLFFQTLLLILLMGKIYYSFWFSFIIFLVFIGGLFILFIYMISLTYNNKFFSLNYKYIYMCIFFLIIIYFNKNNLFINNEETLMNLTSKENLINSLKFFNFPNNLINVMLIMYLLILMIIVVKITNFFSGPIKLNFN